MQKTSKITITPLEQEIFGMVRTFLKDRQLKTVVRVAGGWVRDKLMNKESHDIDLTLDDMKGEKFALMFREYFSTKDEKVSGFGVTRLNPDMSKHLETAKIFVKGLEIDIVNLRSETYTEDKRIPQIEIGTPKQDAERRDLTINSLFYNLLTEEVEDFTGKGLSDLEKGYIRTPLDPYVTFKDDPLRILRCFRFAGRFKFEVDPEIFEAVKKPDIRQILKAKVSKERIGKELMGMLKSEDPLIALRYIEQTQIWDLVFEVPESSNLKDQTMMGKVSLTLLERMKELLKKTKLEQLPVMGKLLTTSEQHQENAQVKTWTLQELRLALLLTSIVCVYQPYTVPVNKKKEPLVRYIIRESLKLPNKEADFACRISDGAKSLRQVTRIVLSSESLELLPMQIRLATLIRWIRGTGEVWECSFLLARCANIEQQEQQRLDQIEALIQKHHLEDSHLATGHIDGDYVIKVLGIKGASIRTILDNAAIWKLLNQSKSKEEFEKELTADLKKFQDPNYLQAVTKQSMQIEESGFAW